ncbi:glycine cleavage system H protein [Streptomyces sp. NPDC046557]|uniref:glycine cleavage system protein H n=1 Tax=Streptomyces sp. NPDC046557 TaxID=3155372 RepID=UPI0033DD4FA4
MCNIPAGLYFSESHEWVRPGRDGLVDVGISDHAQQALGDLITVELTGLGTLLWAGDAAGVLRGTRSAAGIHAPVSGQVVAVNEALENAPHSISSDPYRSWIYRLRLSNPLAHLHCLLDASGYRTALGTTAARRRPAD